MAGKEAATSETQHLGSERSFLRPRLRGWFHGDELERIRLSPLKVLLYLESHERGRRVSAPDKLGQEVGIGGYGTITDSYLWLISHGCIAPAPGVPGAPSEIKDPNEFVVTDRGESILKPYLATFSLGEVATVAGSTLALGFFLGLAYILFELYPSYYWLLTTLGLAVGVVVLALAAITLKAGRERYRARVASLMESVVDRG